MTLVTRFRFALAALALLLAGAATAHAGGGPENVFLIVNANGARSKEVANHYISLRKIPAINVFYAPSPPNAVRITGVNFRDKILLPALAAMDRRGIREQIDHIVYSCDFPFIVDCSTLLGVPNEQGVNRPVLSITGATYLYQFVEAADKNILAFNTNSYFAPSVGGRTESRAFHGRDQWLPGGVRVATGGVRYLLATQLGCSQPEGNTVADMLKYLTRAAGADGTRPEGTFFYMQNNDVRSKVRHDGFPAAVAELRALGLNAQIGAGIVPRGQAKLLGLTTGAIHVRLPAAQASLAAGAIVDNFTSSGGVLTRVANPNPQTRISEYLRLGAAGASGTVIEPFAIAAKFPAPALQVHYARGCTLAEAYYQSVQAPFQLLVLGDPLCQPWAQIPQVTVGGVGADGYESGTIELAPSATIPGGGGVLRFELYVDGRQRGQQPEGGAFALDTTKLSDGFHELRVIAVADTPIETQGRWIGDLIVKNGADATSVTAPAGPRVAGPQLSLQIASTVEGTTAVYHNGRELGRVTGLRGMLQVPTEKLGRGPVMVTARTVGAKRLESRPLVLEIQ
jgi:hypothetical protein